MAGHISVEIQPEASRVLESRFPGTLFVEIDAEMVKQWSCQFTQIGLVILGAGPPCQGVSGLNCDRKGALRDHRSNLYVQVKRIKELVMKAFPWAQVHCLMESIQPMDGSDRELMSEDFGGLPSPIDALISLARRPRLYWISWELESGEGAKVFQPQGSRWDALDTVELQGKLCASSYVTPGRLEPARTPSYLHYLSAQRPPW